MSTALSDPRTPTPQADVVFVGAGHNALVAAAYLLDAGRSVALLERMPQPGGFVRTVELGAPGFVHDRWSAVHPVFVGGPAWAELGPELRRHGLEYVTAPLATGSSLPDGRAAVAPVDQEAMAAELDRLGETDNWTSLFGAAGGTVQTLAGLAGDGYDGPAASRWTRRSGSVRSAARRYRRRSGPRAVHHGGAALTRGAVAAALRYRAGGFLRRIVGRVR